METKKLEKVATWMAILGIPPVSQFVGYLTGHRFTLPTLSGPPKVQSVLLIGLAAAALHHLLVEVGQIFLKKKYDAGAASLPEGWTAALLSASMTVPLVVTPLIYGKFFNLQVVQSAHLLASCGVILASAVGHVALYGIKSVGFLGLKPWIFPLGSQASRLRLVGMEAVFAFVHFFSVVLVYRSILRVTSEHISLSVVGPTVGSAFAWFLMVTMYGMLTYPETVTDEGSVERRGIINGFLLLLTLEVGMLI